MNKSNLVLNLALFILAALFSSCNYKQANQPITVATAANMQPAMKEIIQQFTKKTGLKCDLIVSSSGKLTAQIVEGAPYDVFISADMKYPTEVFEKGLATEEPEVYANGKLVLWASKDSINPSIDLLTSDNIKHIAIANPKTAPYGIAAIEVLTHYGIYEKVTSKLVFGESISQTNQFITSQAADIGFTAMSTVMDPAMKGKGKWVEVDASTYSPIHQGMVVIKHEGNAKESASAFYDYMLTEKAKTILRNFGYSVNE